MTTGRINYSPDYKSEKPPAVDYMTLRTEIIVRCPECGNSDCGHANASAANAAEQYRERQRLRDAVVEAAIKYHDDMSGTPDAQHAFFDAVNALLEFESQQDQK